MFPRSLILFAATAVVALLQLSAMPGLFLMLMGAAFWPVVTVNVGFIGIGVEALWGSVSRLWLAAPILWFGGYLAAAAINQDGARSLAAQVAQENASQHLPFAPAGQVLVIGRGGNVAGDQLAVELLQRYDVPVVYLETGGPDRPAHVALRLGGRESCAAVSGQLAIVAGLMRYPLREDGYTLRDDLCVYAVPQEPTLPVLRLTIDRSDVDRDADFWLPTRFSRIRLTSPDGQNADVTAGSVRPLSWLPQPMFGCFPLDSSPGWVCRGTFGRGPAVEIDGGSSEAGAIAKALGLTASALDARRERLGAGADPEIARALDQRVERSAAQLDRILRSPTGASSASDELLGLDQRPDLLAPRADAMVAALASILDLPAQEDRARTLQDLLAKLDDASFHRVAPAILQVFEPLAERRPDLTDQLAERLGDAGRQALPLLTRVAFAEMHGHVAEGALLGICRIGAAAAPLADRIATVLARTQRHDEAHFAAYVTLLRLNRADLADRDPHANETYAATDYAQARDVVNAASAPDLCLSMDDWRNRYDPPRGDGAR